MNNTPKLYNLFVLCNPGNNVPGVYRLTTYNLFESGVGFKPTCALANGFADHSFQSLRHPDLLKFPRCQRTKKPDFFKVGFFNFTTIFFYENDFPTMIFLPLINEQNIPMPLRLDVDTLLVIFLIIVLIFKIFNLLFYLNTLQR